ncbi:RAD52 motif-containing protein 1-like isoform X1 [Lineus longissimus]|uniref:RAD52 motif-containing protein 1-like isoform X1 n=1 Tax=Lineus longissimus TaxID=88925 RepID=UPI00315D8708
MNKQLDKKKDHLYVIRAKELANHYLGFNGWTTEIVKFEPHEVSETDALEADDNNQERVEYVCVLRLKVPEHGIAVEGVGIGDGTWGRKV